MPILTLANSLIDRDQLGKGVKYPLTMDKATGDFARVANEDNVRECIYWLIATRVGERVMNEDFGTTANDSLFQDIEAVADVLPFQIADVIARYEPRVTHVKLKTERTGVSDLRITITWIVRSTGRGGSLVYPYYTEPAGGGIV